MSTHYLSILQTTPDLICELDNNKVYVWMNDSALRFFGPGAIGKEMSFFECEGTTEIYQNIRPQTLDTEQVFSIQSWHRRFDGTPRLLVWWRKHIKNDSGEIIGTVMTGRDITENKKIEQEKDLLIGQLRERNKELHCLYQISKLTAHPLPLVKLCPDLIKLITEAWQYPAITCVRIAIDGQEYSSPNFKNTNWKQIQEIKRNGELCGSIEVCYLKQKPQILEGPFLQEERDLLVAISEHISGALERMENEQILSANQLKLEESNITLKNILAKVEEEKNSIRENMAQNIEKNVLPFLEELKELRNVNRDKLQLLENNLKDLSNDFYKKIVHLKYNLTPTEIEVCKLVKAGYSGKKIADIMCISFLTVSDHKKNIRKKLQINNRPVNLRTFLNEIL